MSDRPDGNVQGWLDGLSFKVKKKLAQTIKEQADMLAGAIKDAAPVYTGTLRDSVQVRRGKNTVDLVVTAGGAATTKQYSRSTDYSSPVVIDGRDNSGKQKVEAGSGDGVGYDYAIASEFGTTKEAAEPFFYNTYRAHAADIRQAIDDAVDEAVNS